MNEIKIKIARDIFKNSLYWDKQVRQRSENKMTVLKVKKLPRIGKKHEEGSFPRKSGVISLFPTQVPCHHASNSQFWLYSLQHLSSYK